MLQNMRPDGPPSQPDRKPASSPRVQFRRPGEATVEPPLPEVPTETQGPRFYRDLLERVRREGEDRPGGQALLRHAGCTTIDQLREKAEAEDIAHRSADRVAADAELAAAQKRLEDAEARAHAAAAADAERDQKLRRLDALRKRLVRLKEEIVDAQGAARDAAEQLGASLASGPRDAQEGVRRSQLAHWLIESRIFANEVLPDAVRRVEQEITRLETEFGGSARC